MSLFPFILLFVCTGISGITGLHDLQDASGLWLPCAPCSFFCENCLHRDVRDYRIGKIWCRVETPDTIILLLVKNTNKGGGVHSGKGVVLGSENLLY